MEKEFSITIDVFSDGVDEISLNIRTDKKISKSVVKEILEEMIKNYDTGKDENE